jgi:hypothetical protein
VLIKDTNGHDGKGFYPGDGVIKTHINKQKKSGPYGTDLVYINRYKLAPLR